MRTRCGAAVALTRRPPRCSTRTCPAATTSPGAHVHRRDRAGRRRCGRVICIFIASSTTTASPTATRSPSATAHRPARVARHRRRSEPPGGASAHRAELVVGEPVAPSRGTAPTCRQRSTSRAVAARRRRTHATGHRRVRGLRARRHPGSARRPAAPRPLDPVGVDAARHDVGVRRATSRQEPEVRRHADDVVSASAARSRRGTPVAILGVRDHLRQQRVVLERRPRRRLASAVSIAHAGPARAGRVARTRPPVGQEAVRRILGVDPRLDRVAPRAPRRPVEPRAARRPRSRAGRGRGRRP